MHCGYVVNIAACAGALSISSARLMDWNSSAETVSIVESRFFGHVSVRMSASPGKMDEMRSLLYKSKPSEAFVASDS